MEEETTIVATKTTCYKCITGFDSYLNSNAYSIICPKCGTLYTIYNGVLEKTTEIVNIPENPIYIPIGTSGIINGIKYLVIGYAYKKENGTNYCWQEYTLFNPIHGQAYLSQYEGHWTYLTELNKLPLVSKDGLTAIFDGTEYNLFSRYKAELIAARSEWIYRFSTKEMPRVEEFVIPGCMISREQTNVNITWYKGEYIQPEIIKKEFKVESMPEIIGVGAIQPFRGKFKTEGLRNLVILLVAIWGIAQLCFLWTAKEEIVFTQAFTINDSLNKKEIYSKPFDLKYGTTNAEVKVSTNIDNNWMYTAITLVNEKTGDLYDVDMEAEYYHGYEGGENWSEGENWVSKVISQVPEGRYYLIIYPEKPTNMASVFLDISVARDVFVFSNGLIILVILGIFPAFYFYRVKNFEKKRWYYSNFSPYEDDEDD